jgi:16S rRNA processing protein RimM
VKTIGRITKTYGFEGAVVVRSESGITGEPKQGEPVFVVTDGIPVPFFTREAHSPSRDMLIISFDDYLTDDSVAHLKGCEVRTKGGEEPVDELAALAGYILTDTRSGFSGAITEIVRNPGQLMAVAVMKGEEVLIPLHPDLIISVDRKHKSIRMNLPEGLIQLND